MCMYKCKCKGECVCVCVCVCVCEGGREREISQPCSMLSDSVASFSGVGRLLFCHNFSMLSRYSMSFSNSCTKCTTYSSGHTWTH